MTKHRKPRPCPLCGEPKLWYSDVTVCRKCRDLYEFGKAMKDKTDEHPVTSVTLGKGWLDKAYEKDGYPTYEEIFDALEELIFSEGITVSHQYMFYEYQRFSRKVVVRMDKTESLHTFLLQMEKMFELAYINGKTYGMDLLKRLNDGDLSYDEFIRRKDITY